MPERKIKVIKGKKSIERVKDLKKRGYEIKEVNLANGEKLILKRKLPKK
jgi:N-dimethylarginine dimethylaminohydrolase